MSVGWKEALFFVGGIAAGLYIAKLYARSQVNSAIQTGLDKIGLGSIAPQVEGLVTPVVVG